MSHEVLTMKRDYDRSRLEAARARATKAALGKSLAHLDAAIARVDALVKTIDDSPYLRALDRHAAIAFVPYENVSAATPGAKVYACSANFMFCKKVGYVLEILEGEVTSRHPTQATDVRGVLVEMDLSDLHDAESVVLHLGRAPLLL
jgi:hypothetical protein